MLLVGPSGALCMIGHWGGGENLTLSDDPVDCRVLRSLDYFPLHAVQSLMITEYNCLSRSVLEDPYSVLPRMKDLSTLTLIRCNSIEFIVALNPDRNPSKIVSHPKLKELTLYVESRDRFYITPLMKMARERELRGAKLRLITIVGLGELLPGKEVFKLRKHVEHVEYKIGEDSPEWG